MTRPRISAIVLAGGEGRRVDGQDKGLLIWRGLPLIEQVVARIAPQVDQLLISANRNRERYAALGYPVIADTTEQAQGPLAGIAACAPYCDGDWTLITGCDTPRLPADTVARLFSTLREQQCLASFADDGKQQHYLCSLVRTDKLVCAGEQLRIGQRSVKAWLARLHARPTRFTENSEAFCNINQLSQFSAISDKNPST